MWEIAQRIPVSALIILGIWTSFGDGMIFGWLGDVLETRLKPWMCKPIFSCLACMSSVWGSASWFYFGGSLTLWLPFVLALCGTMKLIDDNLIK